MKPFAAFLCLLVLPVLIQAQTQPAPEKAAPAKAKAAPGAANKNAKKPAELPTIPGKEIARADGTFLGLEVVGGKYKLSFYDAKKKSVPPTVILARARWPNRKGPGDYSSMLKSDGNALISEKPVVPPFNFNVYLTLLKKVDEENYAVEESFVVPFRG
ncbi:MAG: hypothetical protein JNG83_09995 [Opitutaceae bacterium]|nr:hypothetical protein [Opitutaceae bacterium]